MPTSDSDEQRGQRSEISGSVSDAVQARDIHGDVHFHGAGQSGMPVPRQLPGDVSGFVNRLNELKRLNEVLAEERGEPLVVGLFIITGTAGVGKTSLALHWAHGVRQRFPGGQLYVNLRGYDAGPPVSPEEALDRFLRALGVPPGAIPPELEDRAVLYRSLLAERRMLVVLDNAATVRQVRPLLPGNAECLVLVTSRSRLSGLVARDGARRLSLDTLSEEEAVILLRAVTAGYRAHDDPEELIELARLCARLPLALRIAAERASSRPMMLLTELIADLRDESALWDALTAEDGDEADAVRTVFAWSYRSLPETVARLFRLLGLHPGPEFGLAAAAALAGRSTGTVRHQLDALVGAHMLEQHAPNRYQFHDLLRAYAIEQATQHESPDDRRAALVRILAWYAHTAGNAVAVIAPLERQVDLDLVEEPAARHFTDLGDALAWYEKERVNLVSAIRAAAAANLPQLAWRIPAILRSVYVEQNPFDDWIATSHIGLDSARQAGDRFGEAEMLFSLGSAYLQSHRLDRADEQHRAALAIREEIGDRYGVALSVNALGLLDWRRRRLTDAVVHFEASLAIVRELDDLRFEALLLGNLGMAHHDAGQVEQAAAVLATAVDSCRALGDRGYEGNTLFFLAMAQRESGRVSDALASIEQALAIAREDRLDAWGAFWLLELARVRRALGQPAEALASCQRSASVQRRFGDRNREAMALDATGEVYRELGRPDEAAKFHRLAAATHRATGDRWSLGTALINLGVAVRESGEAVQARALFIEALAALDGFEDPRAQATRARINDIVADL